jgi:hypothetical protein
LPANHKYCVDSQLLLHSLAQHGHYGVARGSACVAYRSDPPAIGDPMVTLIKRGKPLYIAVVRCHRSVPSGPAVFWSSELEHLRRAIRAARVGRHTMWVCADRVQYSVLLTRCGQLDISLAWMDAPSAAELSAHSEPDSSCYSTTTGAIPTRTRQATRRWRSATCDAWLYDDYRDSASCGANHCTDEATLISRLARHLACPPNRFSTEGDLRYEKHL